MRAALDAWPAEHGRAVVIEAVQRGLCTTAALRHELEDGPRRASAVPRRAVEEAEAGAWSVPEAVLLALLVADRAFPTVWANPISAAWTAIGCLGRTAGSTTWPLAVPVHSRHYHADPSDWDRTAMTDGVYAEHGVVVVAVTPNMIARQPEAVLERVRRSYGAAALRPRPAVVARPRPTPR